MLMKKTQMSSAMRLYLKVMNQKSNLSVGQQEAISSQRALVTKVSGYGRRSATMTSKPWLCYKNTRQMSNVYNGTQKRSSWRVGVMMTMPDYGGRT